MKQTCLAYLTCWLGLLFYASRPAQTQSPTGGIGIGITTPDTSAIPALTASDKGLFIPRLVSARCHRRAGPRAGRRSLPPSPDHGHRLPATQVYSTKQ